MKPHSVSIPFSVLLVGLASACSSSPLSAPEAGEGPAGVSGAPSTEIEGPTSTWAAYPSGPYGTTKGSVIQNLTFSGWHHPDTAGYDLGKLETVRLSDFYDPEGKGTVKLLAINASAVWCSVCRAEYQDMNTTKVYETYRAKGVEILGALFEDNLYYPAQPQDLKNWGSSSRFQVKFPLVLDPGFKLGNYFDSDATPLNMLVDVRTMTIVSVTMGYSTMYWAQVDTLLAKLP